MTPLSNKLLLVDGSNLLFQMFFGMPARIIGKNGKPIHGTLGFIGALLKIIKMTNPSHIAVIFDGEHEKIRSKTDSDYKANRTDYSQVPNDETPFSQLPDIFNALDCLGIKYTETVSYETDDIIAGYVNKINQDFEIVISSFDSDFFQLINERVSVLRYRGDKSVVCDTEYIKNKYRIIPSQYADFKSLTGDNSDNIKGADKIGPKTAAQLLNQFGDLRSVIDNSAAIAKLSVRLSVESCIERLLKNKMLIELSYSEELPFSISELLYNDLGLSTNQIMIKIGVK